jgi:hypothetical protein
MKIATGGPADNATFTGSFSGNRGVKLIFRVQKH